MNISLKRISHSPRNSEETECFAADICLDGKVVGEVKNDGRGGCDMYYWKDAKQGAAIEAWAKTQKYKCPYDNEEHESDLDIIIGELLNTFLSEKEERRWCKTKICFRRPTTEAGTWITIKMAWDAKSKAAIRAKYPDIVEFLNDKFAPLP